MEFFLICLAGILIILSIAGCFVPIIPGPPIGYVGMLIMRYVDAINFSNEKLIILLIVTIIVQVSDYILPIWFTKKFGGSKLGMIGSTIGLIAGLFFPPIGIIVGPIIGAIGGELVSGKEFALACKSGLGSFIGFITTTGAKLIVCFVFLYYFVTSLI